MRTLAEQADIIHNAGYRLTRSRQAVLEVLARAEGFLDPAAIHEQGRGIHPRLGRVSVYRALDLLTELGLVRRVHGADGCHSYARADRSEGHYLVCQDCGQVKEFPCAGLDELVDSVGRRFGFVIEGHLLQLDGLCPDCR